MLKIWAFLKEEHEMVDPELDPVFTQKVSKPLFVILSDGRILEGCRYFPDTQEWVYQGLNIFSYEIKRWGYMQEKTVFEEEQDEI